MAKNFESISLETREGVSFLTLRRPDALNSLSPGMIIEMRDAIDVVAGNAAARVLVLSGEGRAFCAGADLSNAGHSKDPSAPRDVGLVLEDYVNPLIRKLRALDKPVIAAVNGAAAGVGCSLALHADFVLVGRSTYFLQAFVNLGLVPDGGASWLLPRLVGRIRATEMLMLGERIRAEQALQWGLATSLHEDDNLAEATLALAQKLAAGPTKAYALIRRAIELGLNTDLDQALDREREFQREAGYTSDYAEGIRAFKEKRRAVFTGE